MALPVLALLAAGITISEIAALASGGKALTPEIAEGLARKIATTKDNIMKRVSFPGGRNIEGPSIAKPETRQITEPGKNRFLDEMTKTVLLANPALAQALSQHKPSPVTPRDIASPQESLTRDAFQSQSVIQTSKHPSEMTPEEFQELEGKGMGVTWNNAMKAPDGKIFESGRFDHGDMAPDIEDQYGYEEGSLERGWTWRGFKGEQSYIGVGDVGKANGSFYEAYKAKFPQSQQPLEQEAKKYKSAEEFIGQVPFSHAKDSKSRGVIRKGLEDKTINKNIEELIPNPKNQQIEQSTVKIYEDEISEGKKHFLVIDEKGNVIDGHHKLKAYKNLGINEVPVVTKQQLTDIWNKAQGGAQ